MFSWMALACAPAQPAESDHAVQTGPPALPWAVDHVIVGIDSLERGIALITQITGVSPRYGGAHPGRGTRNALIALGRGRYLELMAPNPTDSAGTGERSAQLRSLHTLTPIGWAVRTGNADSVRDAMARRGLHASAVSPGSRVTPSGATLHWRTFDPWGTERDALPFLIEWDRASEHPSTGAPPGCTLEALRMVSPRADSLHALLDRAGMPVNVQPGARESLEVTLDCPAGRVTLP